MKFCIVFLVILKICSMAQSQGCGTGYTATASFILNNQVTEIGIDGASVDAARAAGFDGSKSTAIVVDYDPFSAANNGKMLQIAKQHSSDKNVMYYTLTLVSTGSSAKSFCAPTTTDMGQLIYDQNRSLLTNNGNAHSYHFYANQRAVYASTAAAKLFKASDPEMLPLTATAFDTQDPLTEQNITPLQKGLALRTVSFQSDLEFGSIPNPDTADAKISTFGDAKDIVIGVNNGKSFPMSQCADTNQQWLKVCTGQAPNLSATNMFTVNGLYRINNLPTIM